MRFGTALAVLSLVAIVLLGCPHGSPGEALSYSVEMTQLDFVEPKGNPLNDLDWAAGGYDLLDGRIASVVWIDGALKFVQDQASIAMLNGINNKGVVVGRRGALNDDPDQFVGIVDSAFSQSSFRTGVFYSVNEYDEIVGGAAIANGRATLNSLFGEEDYDFEGPNNESAVGYGINNLRDFVGSSTSMDAVPVTTAQRWTNGLRVPLDSLGGPFSEAYAINDDGTSVGVSTFAPAGKTTVPHKAVSWPDTNVVELPGLGGDESTAWDINSEGAAVGFAEDEAGESRAVLWSAPGQSGNISVTDLNDVVDLGELEPGSLILRDALDINEIGTILCRADQIDGATTETVYVLLKR